jgi:hypothetical protein
VRAGFYATPAAARAARPVGAFDWNATRTNVAYQWNREPLLKHRAQLKFCITPPEAIAGGTSSPVVYGKDGTNSKNPFHVTQNNLARLHTLDEVEKVGRGMYRLKREPDLPSLTGQLIGDLDSLPVSFTATSHRQSGEARREE